MNKYLKYGSIIAFLVCLAGIFYLIHLRTVLSKNPFVIVIQACSVGLMIWARITFGSRSFHAAANTTHGELVTDGPYKWWRHPIYASIIYFFIASFIAYPEIQTFIGVFLVVLGTFARMLFEEKALLETYEGYADYCKKTKRIIPYVF